MTDINLVFDQNNGTFDWSVVPGDLATGNDLQSAVALSLFTDARAPADYQPTDGTSDLRGWWGDTYSPTPWGSLLWQLDRAEISNQAQTIQQAQQAAAAALQWLIDDGVAVAIAVVAQWLGQGFMQISVTITQPRGGSQNFSWAWNTVAN
jgi:phage gp46-like protein